MPSHNSCTSLSCSCEVLEELTQEWRQGNWEPESLVTVIKAMGKKLKVPCLQLAAGVSSEDIANVICCWIQQESCSKCTCRSRACVLSVQRIAWILGDYRYKMAEDYIQYLLRNNVISACFPTREIINPVVETILREGTATGWRPSYELNEYAEEWMCDHGLYDKDSEGEGEGMIEDDAMDIDTA